MKHEAEILHTITKAAKRPNGRKLRRLERSLEKGVQKALNGQRDFVIKEAKKLLRKHGLKTLDDDIDDIFIDLDDEELLGAIDKDSKKAMLLGGKYRVKVSKLAKIGIDFTLKNPEAIKYLETTRPLELAKMTDTVKNHITPILKRGIETGASVDSIAKEISDNFAFSSVRSTMIASNEIGHAYVEGNFIPVKDAVADGHKAVKEWLTVGDNKVTEECRANQSQGKIKHDKKFSSGDEIAPRDNHPRCRCDTLFEVTFK